MWTSELCYFFAPFVKGLLPVLLAPTLGHLHWETHGELGWSLHPECSRPRFCQRGSPHHCPLCFISFLATMSAEDRVAHFWWYFSCGSRFLSSVLWPALSSLSAGGGRWLLWQVMMPRAWWLNLSHSGF